jgi:hypothetical protein
VNDSETYLEQGHINYVLIGSLFGRDEDTVTNKSISYIPAFSI